MENFFKPKIITEGGIENTPQSEQSTVSLSTYLLQVRGKEKIEGEREKTKEELELLKLTHRCLEEEFLTLGLPAPTPQSEDSFHFLPSMSGGKLGTASMDSRSVVLYPEKSPNTLDFAKVILHESIHVQSHGAFIYRNGSFLKALDSVVAGSVQISEKSPLSSYRNGYMISNTERDGVKDHEHFRAFNEGVVDKMALELSMKYVQEIFDIYKDSSEKKNGFNLNNYDQINLVGEIIEGIAKQKGKNEEDVWKTIKKGLFTGEMMSLRDIERVYGKDSLKVLDSSVAAPKTEEEIERNEDVFLYFWMFNKGKTKESRDRIKERILKISESTESLEESIKSAEEQLRGGGGD